MSPRTRRYEIATLPTATAISPATPARPSRPYAAWPLPQRANASVDEDAADQAADVAADRDAAADAVEAEVEREVDHDERHRLAAETTGRLPLEDEHRAEDPEDRTGRADVREYGVATSAPADPARPETT